MVEMKLISFKLACKSVNGRCNFCFFTTKVTKLFIFIVEINISDPIDHFHIYIKIHQGALMAQKNQNKH